MINDTKINPNIGGKILNSSLNFAVNMLWEPIVAELLTSSTVSLWVLDKEGNNVFHICMKRFKWNIVEASKILHLLVKRSSDADLS